MVDLCLLRLLSIFSKLYPPIASRGLGQQNIYFSLGDNNSINHTGISVRVLDGVIVHPDGGPHAQSRDGLTSLLNAYRSLTTVGHVEADALVFANLCNLVMMKSCNYLLSNKSVWQPMASHKK